MKNKMLKLFLPGLIMLFVSIPSNAQTKETYRGKWSFVAPSAPEGFTNGIIEIKKDSVYIAFTDGNYRFPSNWIKVKGDSLIYESSINSEAVLFSLKMTEKLKITGNAVWSGGETLMVLTKKGD
jgi:hypothetical protein